MSRIDTRLKELGLVLPQPLRLPPGVVLPFPWVRVVGTRALISGHGPTQADGSLAMPLGKVGAESLRVFRSCPLITPKDARSSLQMLAIARAMAALCA